MLFGFAKIVKTSDQVAGQIFKELKGREHEGILVRATITSSTWFGQRAKPKLDSAAVWDRQRAGKRYIKRYWIAFSPLHPLFLGNPIDSLTLANKLPASRQRVSDIESIEHRIAALLDLAGVLRPFVCDFVALYTLDGNR